MTLKLVKPHISNKKLYPCIIRTVFGQFNRVSESKFFFLLMEKSEHVMIGVWLARSVSGMLKT